MDDLAASALTASSSAESAIGLSILKKSQDLMAQQAAALLATLPAPPSPSPPGVGGQVDLMA
ncbi:MAG TPA: putative motility protein [Fibrobacteria bacterium]|nr:putative motility protein [Fibrobacteria bacterium]